MQSLILNRKTDEMIKRKILAIFIIPMLYVRWQLLILLSGMAYLGASFDVIFFLGLLYFSLAGLFLPLGLMCDKIIKILRIKYDVKTHWSPPIIHSASYWVNPVITIDGDSHDVSIAKRGGNMHSYESALKRKVIFLWLMIKTKKQ